MPSILRQADRSNVKNTSCIHSQEGVYTARRSVQYRDGLTSAGTESVLKLLSSALAGAHRNYIS